MTKESDTSSRVNETTTKQEVGGTDDVVRGLEKMGYHQELTRVEIQLRSLLHSFGLAAPIATSLIAGGPANIIWGWVLISITSEPLAVSLAEVCSKYPTSAGAYYWCFRLGSPKHRVLLSWINGWLTMVGVWTISLSVTFGTAQILVAGIGIFHPDWEPKAWQTYLVFLAIAVFATLVGIFFNSLLPTIDLVMLVCLSVKAASGRHSANFALTHFDPSGSGWTPGWSFFIGLLPVRCLFLASYTFSATGMVASMAEEVHDPTVQLPLAMSWAIPISFIMGLLFLLPILFTLPDIATLLAVPGGQPIGVLFQLIMGSKGGGFGMWLIIFGIGIFCAISICCAASRATWSFSRDKAIPLHQIWSKVNRRLGDVPVYSYLLSLGIQLLLGLIFLGSTAAFNAFVGVAVMCLGASYAMPIAISVANGRKDMQDAPFSLGKWGFALNVFAIIWVIFEIILFSMPAVIPVTEASMNYASVVFVGFAAISAMWYMINGRHNYKGPPLPNDNNSQVTEFEK
ncbi:hypothetical protein CVT25_003620 [Psilocybe cyanescens]|uniref:Amino acid permease/ SLC12A domain-containing protein n=1 Tax=Psilocybe cyanescens TaxID=93625 RepID=A0A409WPB1_PSICY|nr:hypothetical protein CVT25_003620 [Psilocybe cyanescens]